MPGQAVYCCLVSSCVFSPGPAILRRFRFQLEGFTPRVSGSRGGSRRFLLRGTAVRIKRRQRFALDEQINIVAGDGFAVKQGLGKRMQEIDVFLQQLVAVLGARSPPAS